MKTFKKLNNGFIIRFLMVIEMKIYFYSALSYVINVMDFSTPSPMERLVNVLVQGPIWVQCNSDEATGVPYFLAQDSQRNTWL